MSDATKLTMTTKEAIEILETAGLKATRPENPKTGATRFFEPGRSTAYLVLRAGYRDEKWASYPLVQEGAESSKVSGAFASRARLALEAARKAREVTS